MDFGRPSSSTPNTHLVNQAMHRYVNLREESTSEVPLRVERGQLRSMAETAAFLMNLVGQAAAEDPPGAFASTPQRPRVPPAEFKTPRPVPFTAVSTPQSGTHRSRIDDRSGRRGRQDSSSTSRDRSESGSERREGRDYPPAPPVPPPRPANNVKSGEAANNDAAQPIADNATESGKTAATEADRDSDNRSRRERRSGSHPTDSEGSGRHHRSRSNRSSPSRSQRDKTSSRKDSK